MKDEKKKPEKKSPKHKQEKLSREDLLDLMGVNRDTYTRHNGAIRRKR